MYEVPLTLAEHLADIKIKDCYTQKSLGFELIHSRDMKMQHIKLKF